VRSANWLILAIKRVCPMESRLFRSSAPVI
jgi:hypothetical protein